MISSCTNRAFIKPGATLASYNLLIILYVSNVILLLLLLLLLLVLSLRFLRMTGVVVLREGRDIKHRCKKRF